MADLGQVGGGTASPMVEEEPVVGGLRAACGLKVGTPEDDLSLKRERVRKKRPEREERDCGLRPIRGRLIGLIENSEGVIWLGFHS